MPTKRSALPPAALPIPYEGHARFLPYLLNRTTSLLNAEFNTELRRHGVTLTHWRVLAFLESGESLGVSALSEKIGTDQATLSRALVRMSGSGWIEQSGTDDDFRVVASRLTPKGRALFKKILPVALHLSSRALQGIDSEALASLLATLDAIQSNIANTSGKPA